VSIKRTSKTRTIATMIKDTFSQRGLVWGLESG